MCGRGKGFLSDEYSSEESSSEDEDHEEWTKAAALTTAKTNTKTESNITINTTAKITAKITTKPTTKPSTKKDKDPQQNFFQVWSRNVCWSSELGQQHKRHMMLQLMDPWSNFRNDLEK